MQYIHWNVCVGLDRSQGSNCEKLTGRVSHTQQKLRGWGLGGGGHNGMNKGTGGES